MEDLYNVIRISQKAGNKVVIRGVTLKRAQEICEDEQTSSMTADKPKGCGGDEAMIARWHEKQKHWFYGYTKV